MKLKSDQLLQINATAIVGLLILFTLQTFEPPVDLITKFTIEQIDLIVEKKVVERQIEGCGFRSSELCDTLYERSLEIDSRIEAIDEAAQQLHPFTDIERDVGAYLYAKERIPVQIFYINILMIIPFTSSGVIELINTFRNRKSDAASPVSVILLLLGFVLIVVGLFWISYLTDCQSSAQKAGKCFEVQIKQAENLIITEPGGTMD